LASFEDVNIIFDIGSSGEIYSLNCTTSRQDRKYLWSFQVSWTGALILYPVNGDRFENTDFIFEKIGLIERVYTITK